MEEKLNFPIVLLAVIEETDSRGNNNYPLDNLRGKLAEVADNFLVRG